MLFTFKKSMSHALGGRRQWGVIFIIIDEQLQYNRACLFALASYVS